MKIYFLIFILYSGIVSCTGKPPILEYTIAREAMKYARKVNASRNAQKEWRKAIYFYRKAKEDYVQRYYISSGRLFNESIKWAEKAENLSRLKLSKAEGI